MNAQTLPREITIGDKYRPAMAIETQAEADEYFDVIVRHSMGFGMSREDAEKLERTNLGYYAGYGFDRERVERLFGCEHPVFGKVAHHGTPSPEHALRAGAAMAGGTP